MPKPKPQPKKKKPAENTCTALMVVEKTAEMSGRKRPSPAARIQTRMNLFVRQYEKYRGNITATCEATGIPARTYYRWMQGEKLIHRQFQQKIKRLPVGNARLDLAEETLDKAMVNGNVTAAFYILNNKGQSRGYNLAPLQQAMVSDASLTRCVDIVNKALALDSTMPESEKQLWIRDIAANAGVPEDALVRRLKVLELSK